MSSTTIKSRVNSMAKTARSSAKRNGAAIEVVEAKNRNVAEFIDDLLRVPALPTPQDYLEEGMRSFSRSGLEMARAGRCWLIAKEQIGHGGFTSAIARAGLSEDHVNRAMQLCSFLSRLPEQEARKLSIQPYTKVLALAKADPEVIDELVSTGEIDGIGELSVRQLRERLKRDASEIRRLQTSLETSQRHAQQMARANSALEAESELPRFARSVRHEAFALEQGAGWMLDNFEAICNEELLRDVQHPEAHRWQPVAATNAHAALNALRGRITRLIQQIERAYPSSPDEAIGLDHQLSPLELMSLVERCERMRHGIKRDIEAREAERANTQAGRRGRKRIA
jgi:hypothetical protein